MKWKEGKIHAADVELIGFCFGCDDLALFLEHSISISTSLSTFRLPVSYSTFDIGKSITTRLVGLSARFYHKSVRHRHASLFLITALMRHSPAATTSELLPIEYHKSSTTITSNVREGLWSSHGKRSAPDPVSTISNRLPYNSFLHATLLRMRIQGFHSRNPGSLPCYERKCWCEEHSSP